MSTLFITISSQNRYRICKKAQVVHGNKYDYGLVDYVNNYTPIVIICPAHGTFKQIPNNHLRGMGCKQCSNIHNGSYHKRDTEWFVHTSKQIHDNTYDYSKVEYKQYHKKVEIICHDHGSFFQTAASHIHMKTGCPKCSFLAKEGGYGITRFKNNPSLKLLPGLLYIIRVYDADETFIKIGITHKTVKGRFETNNRLPYNYDVIKTKCGNLYNLFLEEQKLIKTFSNMRYKPLKKFNGHTECFIPTALADLTEVIFDRI